LGSEYLTKKSIYRYYALMMNGWGAKENGKKHDKKTGAKQSR
jgi:hypothetical protein